MKSTNMWKCLLLSALTITTEIAAFAPSTNVQSIRKEKNGALFAKKPSFIQQATSAVSSLALVAALSTAPAIASDYNSFSQEQKAVAEAWRLVDNSYIDRSFNNQDWFQLRQSNVQKKYKSMDEARTAITKMIASLDDKYTRYLSPSKYQSIVDSATGTLAGVGIEIATSKDGRVMASDVEPNSPALRGGVQPKDVFVEVDGTKFDTTSTPDDVALKLRGPEGSKVGVVLDRDGSKVDLILTRAPITITSVRSYVTSVSGVSGKVGVIRVKSFSGTTAEKIKGELATLKQKGASNIVMDLRGNPGGLLPGGVDAASLFLPADKPVVFVASKTGIIDAQSTFAAGVDLETPMVVLVDGNTASAAEVFTAAVKENGRATIVGEQTFGKGVVQTIRPLLDDNGGIAITVAKYTTPSKNDINKIGIAVDIKSDVECPKDDASACLPAKAFKKPTV